MTSAELRRIVGAMTERPFCMCGVGRFSTEPCVKCVAKSTLANHASALVALLEACERRRDARCWSRWPQDDTNIHDCLCGRISDASECPVTSSDRAIMAALASVHATP